MELDTIKLDAERALRLMDKTFHDLFNALPNKPKWVKLPTGQYGWRFEERRMAQAIILKLVRVQSTLWAAKLLLDNGFVQEQSILGRTIDETNEDILFLCCAAFYGPTKLHVDYLEAFWQEEFSKPGDIVDSQQGRPMVSRKKIQKYIANTKKPITYKTIRFLYKVYSGYVHGAAPHIMDMYCGNPLRFHTKGVLSTSRIEDCAHNLNCYILHSLCSYIDAGKVCGYSNKELHDYWNYVKKENNID